MADETEEKELAEMLDLSKKKKKKKKKDKKEKEAAADETSCSAKDQVLCDALNNMVGYVFINHCADR